MIPTATPDFRGEKGYLYSPGDLSKILKHFEAILYPH
jgi:hypothetical protein